ncbi:fibrohexamerin-like [Cydia pomonella]|uniref:fibrohexamerin-like n=1 Tax=Cydia pomonella TaxID=82600 RepID=UPI002ADDF0FA|nr:fibrohexamerin-like [Cydia pomonella]XP_061726551.1 fibrohexamerin-like [Cydia pomonella]
MLTKALVVFAALSLATGKKYGDVVRPCVLSDHHCIRDNLKANSHCQPRVRGSLPGQYTIGQWRFETPYFNASYIDQGLVIRNHDKCRVSEFFFNRKTDVAVIAIDCPNLDFESDRLLLQHYSLKEDSTYNYHIRGKYPLVRLTMNVPKANRLNICNGFTFADVTALPKFHIDPKDKQTADFLTPDLSYLNIYERETFFYRANYLLRSYINSYICDFGCN